MNSSKPRVALFGLGLMGMGMARRLLGAGFPLAVFNRTPGKAASLVVEGAQPGATPRDAAAGADIIISMVADDAASREVWRGEHGALAGVARGAVLIESSTLSPQWISELANGAAKRGCELLDAPVTGSKIHAAGGELCFLVGGSEPALAKALPVLKVMSRAIVHVGPSGSGALLKLINNFLCGVQAVALGEALALIEKSGLDRNKALEVMANGAPGSPLMKTLLSRINAEDYNPNFRLSLMAKDLAYALNVGQRHNLAFAMVAAALKAFKQAETAGLGEKDFAAIVESVNQNRN